MRSLLLAILGFATLFFATPGLALQNTPEQWGEQVAPGIEFRLFQLTEPVPNNVFVARLDRHFAETNLAIESSLSAGDVHGDTETVSDMAQRHDDALNYWDNTWGQRNQVAVAINGYYFDYGTQTAYSGQVHSGWYAKRFTDCATGSGGSGFAWKLDRSAFIGDSVSHPAGKQVITFLNEGDATLEFDGLNVPRPEDSNYSLILYTPQYGKETGSETAALEVLVEMSAPALVTDGDMVTGTVRQIRDQLGPTKIPFDHVVLSATGSARQTMKGYLQVGDQIGISQKIKSYVGECSTSPNGPDWTGTYASIAGAFHFLKDGVIRDFSDDAGAAARAPRTAVAYNDDYIFFLVVDGRDMVKSHGMSIQELAKFVRDQLGATDGIAEDGGGSSTMVINGVVVNNTYCNINYCANRAFFPMVAHSAQGARQSPAQSPLPYPTGQPTPPAEKLSADGLPLTEQYYQYRPDAIGPKLQRLVANGLMMVAVQPRNLSAIFGVGDEVRALFDTEIRLGPGSNYAQSAALTSGQVGTIQEHANGLNGVWAKGLYWWKVKFGDSVGWVRETDITLSGR